MSAMLPRLTVREKAGYGCGDFASTLYWQLISAYLLYFYTDIFGITAVAAGTMILVSRIWDGVNDPMMGMIADRTNTRWGKFRPYLLWMSVPLGIIAVLSFTTPDFGPTGKLVYAWIMYIAFMMVYTAINIPYSSLLGVITPNPVERISVALYKYGFSYFAGGIVSISTLWLAESFFGKNDKAFGWQVTVGLFAVIAVIFFYITFISTKERVAPPKAQKSSVGQDLKDLFTNKAWLILLVATLFMILFVATRISVTTHYFKYYVEKQAVSLFGRTHTIDFVFLASAFNTIGQWFPVLGVICTKWIAKALGKKRAFITLFVIAILSTAAFYMLKPEDVLMMFALQIIGTFCGGPLTPLIWAMYADTADFAEWKNGRRATGLVFSASTMSQKFGWALGTFIAGILLSAVGFKPNVAQPAEVKEGLRLLVSLIPAAAGIISVVLILFYKLDEKTMQQIESDLTQRRLASDGEAEAH